MNNLLILGAGGHGSVVSELAILSKNYGNIQVLDDKFIFNEKLFTDQNLRIIGQLSDFRSVEVKDKFNQAIVAIGDPFKRIKLLRELQLNGYELPTLIHPSSIVSQNSFIGEGTVIMANSVVQTSCKVGLGCIINTGASLDHHSKIGDGVHLCPGVHVGGEVYIGDKSWIGIGSSIIQKVNIGSSVTIGAGSVVVKNVKSNLTVYGNPAEEKLLKQ